MAELAEEEAVSSEVVEDPAARARFPLPTTPSLLRDRLLVLEATLRIRQLREAQAPISSVALARLLRLVRLSLLLVEQLLAVEATSLEALQQVLRPRLQRLAVFSVLLGPRRRQAILLLQEVSLLVVPKLLNHSHLELLLPQARLLSPAEPTLPSPCSAQLPQALPHPRPTRPPRALLERPCLEALSRRRLQSLPFLVE